MKLADWAESQGISYMTARRWYHAKDPRLARAYQSDSGTIIVPDDEGASSMNTIEGFDTTLSILKKVTELKTSPTGLEELAAWILSNFSLSDKKARYTPQKLPPKIKEALDAKAQQEVQERYKKMIKDAIPLKFAPSEDHKVYESMEDFKKSFPEGTVFGELKEYEEDPISLKKKWAKEMVEQHKNNNSFEVKELSQELENAFASKLDSLPDRYKSEIGRKSPQYMQDHKTPEEGWNLESLEKMINQFPDKEIKQSSSELPQDSVKIVKKKLTNTSKKSKKKQLPTTK